MVMENEDTPPADPPRRKLGRPRGVTVLTGMIAVAWLLAMIVEYFSPVFEAPSSLDPLMLLVAGYYFTNSAIENKKKNDREEE